MSAMTRRRRRAIPSTLATPSIRARCGRQSETGRRRATAPRPSQGGRLHLRAQRRSRRRRRDDRGRPRRRERQRGDYRRHGHQRLRQRSGVDHGRHREQSDIDRRRQRFAASTTDTQKAAGDNPTETPEGPDFHGRPAAGSRSAARSTPTSCSRNAQASIQGATLSAGTGGIIVNAEDTAQLNATTLVASSTGGGGSQSDYDLSIAFNSIGYAPENFLFNAVDALDWRRLSVKSATPDNATAFISHVIVTAGWRRSPGDLAE